MAPCMVPFRAHSLRASKCPEKAGKNKIKTLVSRVHLGINVFEINIEREGKEKLASVSTIMTGNLDSSLWEVCLQINAIIIIAW